MREMLGLSSVTAPPTAAPTAAPAAPQRALAGSVAEFYVGKQMKMIIRSAPGALSLVPTVTAETSTGREYQGVHETPKPRP